MKYKFVEYMPHNIDDDTLYISIEYKVAKHKCPCGCGDNIVTTIDPNGWSLIFDGETVSLSPSIGNWTHKCRSHYYIRKSAVVWAKPISEREINELTKKENIDLTSHKRNRTTFEHFKRWFFG